MITTRGRSIYCSFLLCCIVRQRHALHEDVAVRATENLSAKMSALERFPLDVAASAVAKSLQETPVGLSAKQKRDAHSKAPLFFQSLEKHLSFSSADAWRARRRWSC